MDAPRALAARLAQVFVAADDATAEALAHSLQPGQRLVTRDGGLWRWDGYTARAGAPTAGAQRLAQQNQVAALAEDLAEADKALAVLAEESAVAAAAHTAAQQQRQQARDALKDAESVLVRAEQNLNRLSQAKALGESKLQSQRDTLERMTADQTAVDAQLAEAAQTLAQADRPDALEATVIAARAAAADARVEWLGARDTHEQHVRAARARAERLAAIARDIAGWERRASAEQRQSLEARMVREHARAAELAEMPAQLELALASLHDALIDAEANRRVAADKLVEAETAQTERDRELRAAEAAAADANATRIRAEAAYDQARQAAQNLTERLAERLSLTPAGLPEIAEDVDADGLEQRLGRLEREQMVLGDVNLRADTEIQELEERLTTLTAERDDLTAAIAKLRRGIGDLNKNARQKLLTAFETVNGHFERMFTRLFGGGEAQLRLVGDDDPLEAGLEVYACPPGKKPQALTALSGGERALTAVALLFAAFLTNPAPICVLDEVDAPLDDANVDRLCQLIEEIADEAGTRFLVITHHRLTMARMDRLYGVTMEERGVSHLVSVDLRQADLFRKTNPALRAAE